MPNFQEETVIVRGRPVRLYIGGEGPPLVFLHDPFCFSWLPLHERLAARNRVFLPVHPGFAGSEQNFEQFEVFEDLVFHYLDLCAALKLQRPAVAGASFGGWIAAEWGMRYSHALEKLILIDALGLRIDDAPAVDILSLDPRGLRNAVFVDPSSELALEVIPETPKTEAMVSAILSRQALARFAWQYPDNPRLRRYLYRVTAPAMIIWGERDGVVSVAHGEAFQNSIQNSQMMIVPTAGHLPHVEAPDVCAEIIIKFLNETG
jgi:pimeloyl-ACP methyl ester carboxylesterase